MYWRIYFYNHRLRLIAYAVLAIVGGLFTSLPSALVSEHGHWYLRHARDAAEATKLWNSTAGIVLPMLLVTFTFVASDLGASGIGEHVSKRPLDFLLTRPRERRYFVWAGLTAGMLEIIALMVLALFSSCAALVWLTSTFEPSHLLFGAALMLSITAAVFCLSYSMAVISGSARTGYPLALGLTVLLFATTVLRSSVALSGWAGKPKLVAAVDWFLQMDQHMMSVVLACVVATMACILATQVMFERKEI